MSGAIGTELDGCFGARVAVESLLRQKTMLEQEISQLDKHIVVLAQDKRYNEPVQELKKLKGVGLLTAMVFLTEMGDLSRFANRRQVGSFLGLVPSSYESGESDDKKGHITHQEPARVRKVLCQASWALTRTDAAEGTVYDRIIRKNPHHKKIAVVAIMRRLAIRMWHIGLLAQQRANSFEGKTQVVAARQESIYWRNEDQENGLIRRLFQMGTRPIAPWVIARPEVRSQR